jgi:hypothetical protein
MDTNYHLIYKIFQIQDHIIKDAINRAFINHLFMLILLTIQFVAGLPNIYAEIAVQ